MSKPRSGSDVHGFPPPPTGIFRDNSGKRNSITGMVLLPPPLVGSPSVPAHVKKNIAPVERSMSSGVLPLPVEVLKQKQASLPKPLQPVKSTPQPVITALTVEPKPTPEVAPESVSEVATEVTPVIEATPETIPESTPAQEPEDPQSFESLYRHKYGSEEDIKKNRIASNLSIVTKKIDTLQNDLDEAISSGSNPLLEGLQEIIKDLQCKVEKFQSLSAEEIESNLQTVKSFKDMHLRTHEICEGLINHRKESQADPKEGETLSLLKKLAAEESTYTGNLMCLQRFFRGPLSDCISAREDIVLFSELEIILELHKDLLKDIKFAMNRFPAVPIGELLQFHSKRFAPYLAYTANADDSQQLLDRLMKQNKDFKLLLKNLEKKNNAQLVTLLQAPLRKLEQYIIYSEQFYQLTPPKSADRTRLEEVIDNFQSLLDKSAKKANIADQLEKLQIIGMEIEDLNENLVVPDRQLVYEGPIRVKPESGEKGGDYVFLFTDLVIYVQKKGTRKFLFVGKMGMHTVTVSEDSTKNSFQLVQKSSPTGKKLEFILTADDEKLRDEWFLHFSNVQRDVIRYRKVFGVNLKTLVKREKTAIPHFIEKSISFIREYGLHSEGIFRLSGRATQIEKLRDQLDQGKKVFFSENMDVHSVANLFKQWLREMPEPLLTWKLYDDFIAAAEMTDEEEKKKVLYRLLNKKLPKVNRYCFQYMCKVLMEVIANENETKLNATTLSVVFAPNILVDGDPNANPFAAKFQAVNDVFKDMLVNYDFLFSDIEKEQQASQIEEVARDESPKPRPSSMKVNTTGINFIAETAKSEGHKEGILMVLEKKTWVERYFKLKDGALYKFKCAEDSQSTDKRNRTRYPVSTFTNVSSSTSHGKPNVFQIERAKKDMLIIAASNAEEQLGWISSIAVAISSK